MAQRPKPARVQRQQQQREQRRFDAMLQEIARSFSCSSEIARDFVDQCELNRDNLEADLAFSDLALEVWRGRLGVEELPEAAARVAAAYVADTRNAPMVVL